MPNSKKTNARKKISPAPADFFQSAPKPLTLHLRPYSAVNLTLVGCGGTGSHLATGLAALVLDLRERSDVALRLTLLDFDLVEAKNVGRQLFSVNEIGRPKCQVLAERLLRAYALPCSASVKTVESADLQPQADALNLVIGAVDNPAARGIIANAVDRADGALWWLNCGNENVSGQVALGNTGNVKAMRRAVELGMLQRLPAPHVLYPDCIATPVVKPSKRAPSCAELTARGEQGLMVNRMVAAWALQLLQMWLVEKRLNWFGMAFDLTWGNTKALLLDGPTLAEVTKLSVKELGA